MAYKQAANRRCKLEKLYKQTKNHGAYPGGAYFDEQRGIYIKNNLPRFAKYLRKVSNRKVRKIADIGNNGNYRKLYDYKYNLY